METQLAASHNSLPRSSEKSAENSPVSSRGLSLALADDMARSLGMTPTWANVQTVRLAIEGESAFSGISVKEAAAVIAMAAQERTRLPRDPDFHDRQFTLKLNSVDRFWFEDGRWRDKYVYGEFLARLEARVSA